MNALRNERINLHRQVENKNLTNESGLYDEAARIHNEKVKKGLIDNNPDEEWDLDYLLDQLYKIDVIQEKAHKEVDKYLEDKYQMKMSDFEAAEKKIQNFEKGIMALSVTAMLSLIALDTLQR